MDTEQFASLTNAEVHEELLSAVTEAWSHIGVPSPIEEDAQIREHMDDIIELFSGKSVFDVDRRSSQFENSGAIKAVTGSSRIYYSGVYALLYCDYFLDSCTIDGELDDRFETTYGLSDVFMSHIVMHCELPKWWRLNLPSKVREVFSFIGKDLATTRFNGVEDCCIDFGSVDWDLRNT